MKAVKQDIGTLKEENAALQRELRGTQEMLAHVLLAAGGPVWVSKESVKEGLPDNLSIRIDDNLESGMFEFSLIEEDEDDSDEG